MQSGLDKKHLLQEPTAQRFNGRAPSMPKFIKLKDEDEPNSP